MDSQHTGSALPSDATRSRFSSLTVHTIERLSSIDYTVSTRTLTSHFTQHGASTTVLQLKGGTAGTVARKPKFMKSHFFKHRRPLRPALRSRSTLRPALRLALRQALRPAPQHWPSAAWRQGEGLAVHCSQSC